jgi:hypothetical protein
MAKCTARGEGTIVFLKLPLEIRIIIYRLLLCYPEPIPSGYRTPWYKHKCPPILRTCRDILLEAQPLLYGENVFSMTIYNTWMGVGRARFVKCEHFGLDAEENFGSRLKDLRKFEIVVELQGEEDIKPVKSAVRDVCKVLSGFDEICYLRIILNSGGSYFNPRPYAQVLSSFALLRNVQSVFLDGILPAFKDYLEREITGSSPLDHLPKMYDALFFYAGHFDCCDKDLRKAMEAMEENDIKQFKKARLRVVRKVFYRMEEGAKLLFTHDARVA